MTEEDQAWEEAERQAKIQLENEAAVAAWDAAADFCLNIDLARITLRRAFEEGFMEGYKHAKR